MYSVLLYNYRVTRAVENFKEGKQMSHNKILRTVFGVSTGIMLFGMNMVQASFASENITETEPQSISEENTDVIDNQKLLEIDQDQLDTGVVYVTTKDTYFYFPDGCSDDANLLGWAVKWMHETWVHRKSGSADDYVCAGLHSFLHMLFVMFQCHHDIDTNQTSAASDLFCPANMFTYGKAVTSCLIPFKPFLVISNLCRRNNPDASLCRHCTGKRASADTNSHTALNDWFLCCQFSYLEWL